MKFKEINYKPIKSIQPKFSSSSVISWLPKRIKNSYITYRFRITLNSSRILTSFYKSRSFRSSRFSLSPLLLERRIDIILFRSHYVKNIKEGKIWYKKYFSSNALYLTPGDVLTPPSHLLPLILKNKLFHLKHGSPIPSYIISNFSKIILLKNPNISEIPFPSSLFKKHISSFLS